MSFSLKPKMYILRSTETDRESLNPLFHELFSETKRKTSFTPYTISSALNPLFHELFSETEYEYESHGLELVYTLNPLFHELFSETEIAMELIKDEEVSLSILFFMSFSLKH